MSHWELDKPVKVTAQMRGETMAFAAQSALYNLGANFFEPYINYRVQKHFSGGDALHPKAYGNYTQNLAGEFAGDIIGASTLMLAEAICPEEYHRFARKARGLIDPLYTSVAHVVFAKERTAPDYDKKVEDWKTFQERNLVRSAVIATTGILGNVATQKLVIGNPSPTKLIFAGKLISTALTTTLGLTARLAFPEAMKGMDSWMGKTIFEPMMDNKGEGTAPPTMAANPDSFVARLQQQQALYPFASTPIAF